MYKKACGREEQLKKIWQQWKATTILMDYSLWLISNINWYPSFYSTLQQQEFASESDGYTATKHQKEVGTTYFDAVSNTISSGESSTTAMKDSTETEQF